MSSSVAEAFKKAEKRPKRYIHESEKVNVTDSQLRYAMKCARNAANRYGDRQAISRDDLFQAAIEKILFELRRRPELHKTMAWMGQAASFAVKNELRKFWHPQIIHVPLREDDEWEDAPEFVDEYSADADYIFDLLTPQQRHVVTLAAMGYGADAITAAVGLSSSSRVNKLIQQSQKRLVDAGVRARVPTKLERWIAEYKSLHIQQQAQGYGSNFVVNRGTGRDAGPGANESIERKRIYERKARLKTLLRQNGIDAEALIGHSVR